MGFPRPEYCSGVPFPFPGDLPDPGVEPVSLALQADSLLSEPPGKPWMCVPLVLFGSESHAWHGPATIPLLLLFPLLLTRFSSASS